MQDLVVCIGNEARGDDGAARRVAALLEGRLPEGARVISAPQLDIALMDELPHVRSMVIVDAERRAEPAVRVRQVDPAPAGEYGHALEPGHLLDIAWALYSARPRTWLVTLAAPVMEHGVGLSPVAEAAAVEAAETVLRLLGSEA